MDEREGPGIQEKGGGGAGEAGGAWSDVGGATPLPPVFGNANAQAGDTIGDMGFKVKLSVAVSFCWLLVRLSRVFMIRGRVGGGGGGWIKAWIRFVGSY